MAELTKEEILNAFNTPAQKKYDAIRNEANQLRDTAKKLIKKADFLMSKAHKFIRKLDEEGNIVADELDKRDPNWRVTLVKDLKGVGK